jgi:hypothetical protein
MWCHTTPVLRAVGAVRSSSRRSLHKPQAILAGVFCFLERHMSAKKLSRDFAAGKVKHLQRMKQPLALTLQLPAPRNPVVRALAHRAISSGAGKHIRSAGATRRAETVALHKALKKLND